MKLIIDIPKKTFEDLRQGVFITVGETFAKRLIKYIKNGIPLPKGHGRLIDADAFERRCMFDSNIEDMQDVIYALHDYKSIIEADKAERSE